MIRVEEDEMWSLFCPDDVPELVNLHGDSFEEAYTAYEQSSTPRVRLPARELWDIILRTELLTGGPSVIYKDNLNGALLNAIDSTRTLIKSQGEVTCPTWAKLVIRTYETG